MCNNSYMVTTTTSATTAAIAGREYAVECDGGMIFLTGPRGAAHILAPTYKAEDEFFVVSSARTGGLLRDKALRTVRVTVTDDEIIEVTR